MKCKWLIAIGTGQRSHISFLTCVSSSRDEEIYLTAVKLKHKCIINIILYILFFFSKNANSLATACVPLMSPFTVLPSFKSANNYKHMVVKACVLKNV